MAPPDADTVIRDVRQVLSLAGLPEASEGSRGGGYVVFRRGSHAHLGWVTEDGLYDQAGSVSLTHQHHPLAELDRAMIAAMHRAVAEVLYAAGFTVALQPAVRTADPQKGSEPGIIVLAVPGFKTWGDR
jgi:hypothetical protein